MSPDLVCNYADTMSLHPNQASRTPDFSYLLLSFTSCSSSSPISLFLVHNSTIIAEHKVKLSLSISPCRNHELTLSTTIHRVQHTPSTVYTEFSIHRVQRASSTAYTKYTIHRVPHTRSTAYTEYSIHPILSIFPSFSWVWVDIWM